MIGFIIGIIVAIITCMILCNNRFSYITPVSSGICIFIIIAAVYWLYSAPFGFDRNQYLKMFENPGLWGAKDHGWEVYNIIMRIITHNNATLYFLLSAVIYTLGFSYFAYNNIPKDYIFYFLLLLFISIGYYGGGTNVMRSGMAAAMIYFALARYKNKIWYLVFCYFAISIHFSVALIVIAIIIGYYFPKTKWYIAIWCLFVVLSYFDALGGVVEPLVNNAQEDEIARLEKYMEGIGEENELYANAGWRFDFILYSAIPIYFIYKYKYSFGFKSRLYDAVSCGYLIANSFWLCVIRIPYGDRVALISWVFIPLLTIYPALKDRKLKDRNLWAALSYLTPILLNIYNLIK